MLFSAIQAKLLPEPSDIEVKCLPLAVKFLRAHEVQFLVSLGWVGSGWCSDHLPGPKQGALVRLSTQCVSSELS